MSERVEANQLTAGAERRTDAERSTTLPAWVFPTLLTVVMVGAFVLRIWGLRMGLPLRLHPDEWRIVMRAMAMGASGDLNPHTTDVGALMMYVCLVLFALYGGVGILIGRFADVHDIGVSFCNDPTVFYLIARSVSVVCGMLAIYFVYRTCKELAGKWAGLIGAALLGVYPIHVMRSHLAYPDAMMVCFIVAALYVMAREDGNKMSYRTDLLVGGLIGLGAAAKYLAAFAVFAYIVWRVGCAWRNARLLAAVPHMLVGGLACLAGFFVGMPSFLVKFTTSWGAVSGVVVGSTAGHTPPGEILTRLWHRISQAKGFGPLAVLLGVFGGAWGLRRRPSYVAALAVMIALNVFWASRVGRFHGRWAFPAAIAICVLSGLGARALFDALADRVGRRAMAALLAILGVVLLWPSGSHSWQAVQALAGPDTRVIATRWIEEHIPAGASILIDGGATSNPQVRANRVSLERMLDKARAIQNPNYSHIEVYYRYQIEALSKHVGPTYDLRRLSHIWFLPEIAARPNVYDERAQIEIAPGRDLAVPFSEYLSQGVQYVLLTKSALDHYNNDGFPLDQQFYEEMFSKSKLIRTFSPEGRTTGPTILVLGTPNAQRERVNEG